MARQRVRPEPDQDDPAVVRGSDRRQMSPLEAKSGDIFEKMWKVGAELWKSRGDQVIRLPGCPVSVAEQVLALVHLGGS